MDNYKFVQVQGPFKANQDIVQYIKTQINDDFRYIADIGIQAQAENLCKINGQILKIGLTEILICNKVKIESMSFLQDMPESTLIDCVLN